MSTVPSNLSLSQLGNVVPEGYHYYEKIVTPGDDLVLPNAYLKWYDLYPEDTPITPDQSAETRAFVAAEAERLPLAGELGFVILHRAGSMLLLLLTTWRNTNEMWESVYAKPVGAAAGYQLIDFETTHRGTYCVWELGIVWHERHAWVHFLSSARDDVAKRAYIQDRFSGRV
ncbi:MAG TPA: hypothetical protein VHP83_01915 [Aggregatilineaceae bacterium]|nr:hypothetical protein [Aggregatilineaceae bacterium]